MVSLSELNDEINKQLTDVVLDKVIYKTFMSHKKRAFRDCNCSYCKAKKQATLEIANLINAPKVEFFFDKEDVLREPYSYHERKAIIRERMRKMWRQKLKELEDV